MAVAASSKPKAAKPVTTKHLAASLSEQHQLTKKQGKEIMDDLIVMITKHLKKGERVEIAGGHPGGSQARRPHGPQSDDRRSDQDQSQQEGCLPRVQGSEDGDLIVGAIVSQNPADRRRGFCLARTATAHNLRSASYSEEQNGPPWNRSPTGSGGSFACSASACAWKSCERNCGR